MTENQRHDQQADGPGASSGAEQQPEERVVPGMGSATEGYEQESGGTRDGHPVAGVEADPEDRPRSLGD